MPPTITCPSCGRRREHYARALCRACYSRAYQRERWAAMPGDARARRLSAMREAARIRRASPCPQK